MISEFATYKDELRQVALPLRLGGLLGVMLGCALLIASTKFPTVGLVPLGFVALGLGWGVTGYAIWLRTQWAKQHPFTGPR